MAVIERKTNAVESKALEKCSIFVLEEIFEELGGDQETSDEDIQSTDRVKEEL